MKKFAKKILVKIFNPIINKLDYVKRTNLNQGMIVCNSYQVDIMLNNFFSILVKIGFEPKSIVDVGANHGNWTRRALKFFPDAYYTLLEPQSWLKKDIMDILESNNNVKFYAVGAGEKEGVLKFTIVDRDDSCSFRYSEEDAKVKGFKQIEVPVVTLNNLIAQQNIAEPDIIKIDAEGLDIEVLKGANDFFGKTEVFMVEAGVVNKLFDNSFLKVINYMDENGYRLFDITDINRPFKPSVLWLVELVFIKKNGFIDSQTFISMYKTTVFDGGNVSLAMPFKFLHWLFKEATTFGGGHSLKII